MEARLELESVTIEILYSDLSIVKKDASELDTFQKDDILIILFKRNGKNIVSLMGLDHYGVKIEQDSIKHVQFNDEDGCIHVQYFDGTRKRKFRNKMPKGFTAFEGGYVDMPTWKKALSKFETEMQ